MNKRIFLSIILVITWMGLIYYMSSMNRDDSNTTSQSITIKVIEIYDKITNASKETVLKHHSSSFISHINHLIRKTAHFLLYLGLSILVFNLFIHLFKKSLLFYDVFTILICFLYACSDEYHQTFVSGRGGMFSDVLIDIFGALIGCFFINFVYLCVKKIKF